MTRSSQRAEDLDVRSWRGRVLARVAAGERLAGMYATDDGASGPRLVVLLAGPRTIEEVSVTLRPDAAGRLSYPALSDEIVAATWYERALHDLSGIVPVGHPRLDPLLFPRSEGTEHPRPGRGRRVTGLRQAERSGPIDVGGYGLFSLPFGPVRSGVFESIEFLLETPGEDIPYLTIRPHYKHRGVAKQFEGRDLGTGLLVAERVEGIASVAHALAYCHAVEELAGVVPPLPAQLVRVVHAELERIANHLDVAMRLCDAAGLAVATARFAWHKERVQRLVSQLCGSRFGRGVVVPGGVVPGGVVPGGVVPGGVVDRPRPPAADVVAAVADIYAKVRADATVLMRTASFLDRLRGTGVLDPDLARRCGALGPVGRGSGYDDDDRLRRPTDAYEVLDMTPSPDPHPVGDAMARLRVRWAEVAASVALITDASSRLAGIDRPSWREPVGSVTGTSVGWSEAPQGEVLYGLHVTDGVIVRCFARSASFHNLRLLHDVFGGDVYTDFPFIEASFGLSYAGTAM